MRLSSRQLGLASAVVTITSWSLFLVIGRASASRTPLLPQDLGLMRVLGAALVFVPLCLWWRAQRTRAPQGAASPQLALGGLSPLPWRPTLVLGLLGGLLYSILPFMGFRYAPAAHAAVLLPGGMPLWAALMGGLLLGERLNAARLLALGFIVAGGLLVGGPSLAVAFDGGEVWKGDLLFMASSLCWATYGVLLRQYSPGPVAATATISLFALLTYVPLMGLGLAMGWWTTHLPQMSAASLLGQMLFQGGVVVGLAGVCFAVMVGHFGPLRTMMLTALVPGLASLLAVWWLDEPLTWNMLVGLGCVTAGILLGVRAARLGPAGKAA